MKTFHIAWLTWLLFGLLPVVTEITDQFQSKYMSIKIITIKKWMFYSAYKLIYLVYQVFFIYKLLICTTLVPSNDVIRTREPVQHVTDGSNVSGKKFIQDFACKSSLQEWKWITLMTVLWIHCSRKRFWYIGLYAQCKWKMNFHAGLKNNLDAILIWMMMQRYEISFLCKNVY